MQNNNIKTPNNIVSKNSQAKPEKNKEVVEPESLPSGENLEIQCVAADKNYQSGQFFLERVFNHKELDLPTAFTIYQLRKRCMKEYKINNTLGLMILDMIMVYYSRFIKINRNQKAVDAKDISPINESLEIALERCNKIMLANVRALRVIRELKVDNELLDLGW